MSAAPSQVIADATAALLNRVQIEFAGSAEYPRRLSVSRCTNHLTLCMFSRKVARSSSHIKASRMLAFASCEIASCRIDGGSDPALWMDRTSFDLSPIEAEQIAETFGLRVAK